MPDSIQTGQPGQPQPADTPAPTGSLLDRLFKPHVAWMLVRNTVVSSGTFLIGLGVLWLLVEFAGVNKVIAAGLSFIVSNAVHYIFGRLWIYRGTERAVTAGLVLFLINGLVGLVLTMALFAALIEFTPINYLVARVIVSVIAGLVMFVLNAVWNFRRV